MRATTPPPAHPALAALREAARRCTALARELRGASQLAEVLRAAAAGRRRDRAEREGRAAGQIAGQVGAVVREQRDGG